MRRILWLPVGVGTVVAGGLVAIAMMSCRADERRGAAARATRPFAGDTTRFRIAREDGRRVACRKAQISAMRLPRLRWVLPIRTLPFDELAVDHFLDLVRRGVREDRTLDFKGSNAGRQLEV
jgi:hypothetical protein